MENFLQRTMALKKKENRVLYISIGIWKILILDKEQDTSEFAQYP